MDTSDKITVSRLQLERGKPELSVAAGSLPEKLNRAVLGRLQTRTILHRARVILSPQ